MGNTKQLDIELLDQSQAKNAILNNQLQIKR